MENEVHKRIEEKHGEAFWALIDLINDEIYKAGGSPRTPESIANLSLQSFLLGICIPNHIRVKVEYISPDKEIS